MAPGHLVRVEKGQRAEARVAISRAVGPRDGFANLAR